MSLSSCPNAKGFTLVEILLAMAISMMVLMGVGFLYYSIAMAWVSHKEGDLELQHHHSIFAFLEDELSVKPDLPNETGEPFDAEVSWVKLPESGNYDPSYLSWVTEDIPSFLVSGNWVDNFSIRLYLSFDPRKGISLIWHPEDSKIERMDLPRYDVKDYLYEFLLASDVSSLEYVYYDVEDDTWEPYEASRVDELTDMGLPDVLVFKVEHKGEIVTRSIYLTFEEEQGEE